ncbi:MAG: potassium channel family protein [Bacillota bacterium]
MTTRRKVLLAAGFALVLLLAMTVGTQWVFARYEERTLTVPEALLFVMETLTTTGYGEQLPFKSGVTAIWAVVLMVTGFVQISVWLTSLASTWVQNHLQTLPPRHAPAGFKDHVIICGAGAVGEFLARELKQAAIDYVLVDDRRRVLEGHMRDGLVVLEGDVRHAETLQAARIGTARAVVSTLNDTDDASVALVVRALSGDLPFYCTVEHVENERFLRAAGASHVVLAKRTLGERLGWLATAPLAGMVDRLWGDDAGLNVATVPILPGSQLAAPTLREAKIRERTGANVLGLWSHGHFIPATGPDLPLYPGNVLIAAGTPTDLERLKALSAGHARPIAPATGPVLILGFGDVGRAAAQRLQAANIPYRVLSLKLPEGIEGDWVQGDATSTEDLQRAGIEQVGRCIVAIDDDTRSVFATLLVRQLNPGLRIVARANSIEAVTRLYLAGADNVLSVSEIGGAQLARLLQASGKGLPTLEDVETRLVPVPSSLVGKNLVSGQVGKRTGCIVLAIQTQSGTVEITPSPKRILFAGEKLVLFGTAEQFDQFTDAFGR